jgi:hypothetical protein
MDHLHELIFKVFHFCRCFCLFYEFLWLILFFLYGLGLLAFVYVYESLCAYGIVLLFRLLVALVNQSILCE